jgi:hypothetical protein
MKTAREIADELDVPADDVMAVLEDINELTLTSDSPVRDVAADVVRKRIRENPPTASHAPAVTRLAADEQLHRLREKLAGSASGPADSATTVNLSPPRERRKKPRSWRPGNKPLDKVVKALADQIVANSDVWNRPKDVIFGDVLQTAQFRPEMWKKKRIEHGAFVSDDTIVAWIRAFTRHVLPLELVFQLIAEGFTPEEALMKLWYGRINENRPTLMQLILSHQMSVQDAAAAITAFREAR